MSTQNLADIPQLITALSDYYILLRASADHNRNSIDAARGINHNVLAILGKVGIESVPGNERDHIYHLQVQCSYIDALSRPKTDTEIIQRECREAIEQLCYITELVSIPWASAIEALCLD